MGSSKVFFPHTHTHATLLMSTLFAARVAAPNPLSVRDEKIPSWISQQKALFMLTSSDPSSGECFHSKSTIFTTDEAMRREFNSFLDLIKQYFPERDFGFFLVVNHGLLPSRAVWFMRKALKYYYEIHISFMTAGTWGARSTFVHLGATRGNSLKTLMRKH